MNHNPPALLPPIGGYTMSKGPDCIDTSPAPVAMGPVTARIRRLGRDEIQSRPMPNADAALEWAYGYMALRNATATEVHRQFPNGTTVHIGAAIHVLHNRVLRPVGYRRVVAVKSPPKVGP